MSFEQPSLPAPPPPGLAGTRTTRPSGVPGAWGPSPSCASSLLCCIRALGAGEGGVAEHPVIVSGTPGPRRGWDGGGGEPPVSPEEAVRSPAP